MYKVIVAHGAHSAPLAVRFFDNELEPTDNINDINISVRVFGTKSKAECYMLGIADAADDYCVLTAGEYKKLLRAINKQESSGKGIC